MNNFRGEVSRDNRFRKEGRYNGNRYSNGQHRNDKRKPYLSTERLNSDLDKYFMKV